MGDGGDQRPVVGQRHLETSVAVAGAIRDGVTDLPCDEGGSGVRPQSEDDPLTDEWIRGAQPRAPDTVAQVPFDIRAVDDDQWGRRCHAVITIAGLALEELGTLDGGKDDGGSGAPAA